MDKDTLIYDICKDSEQGIYYKVGEKENEKFLKSLEISQISGKTTLKNFFNRELEVMGVDKTGDTIFLLGTEEDLFGKTFYYEPVLILNENRIFKMFGQNFGRDFNYINGKWK